MVKSDEVLQKLELDSKDVFVQGLIDMYINRPDEMKNVCLADFASLYNVSKKQTNNVQITENSDGEDVRALGQFVARTIRRGQFVADYSSHGQFVAQTIRRRTISRIDNSSHGQFVAHVINCNKIDVCKRQILLIECQFIMNDK